MPVEVKNVAHDCDVGAAIHVEAIASFIARVVVHEIAFHAHEAGVRWGEWLPADIAVGRDVATVTIAGAGVRAPFAQQMLPCQPITLTAPPVHWSNSLSSIRTR